MKLYKATVVVVILLMAWTTFSTLADDDYAQCDPYCVAFLKIGPRHLTVAVDSSGNYLESVAIGGRAARALLGTGPFNPFSSAFQHTVEREGCEFKASTAQYTTRTQHVTVLTTTMQCDGKLVDVNVTVLRVDVAAAPFDN